MENKTADPSLSAGFWLPCGRASFVNTRADRALIRALVENASSSKTLPEIMKDISKDNPLECSVLHRLCHVFSKENCRFDRIQLVKPEYIEGEIKADDDPEGLYAYASSISYKPYGDYGDQADKGPFVLRNVHVAVDHNGFYFCWLTGPQDEKIDKKVFEGFLIDLLQGWETLAPKPLSQGKESDFPYSVDVEKYTGILTFSQLNLVIEGLNNYFFDPDVFFEHRKENLKEELQKNYGLHTFFDSIVTPLNLSPEPTINPHLGVNSLLSSIKGQNIVEEVLRQFLVGTSVNIQSLKWAVEKCRRHLLSEVISEAHRRSELRQIRTHKEGEKQPNSALLKGYIMFLGAKMPVLLNVQRHLKAVHKEGEIGSKNHGKSPKNDNSQLLRNCIEKANLNLSELFYSWISLVQGLNDNVISIDHAIAQSRQDRILHEQEQIRAEQEASAEAARISERSGTSSISMDEEASARGANLLALLSMLLAGAALLAQSVSPQGAVGQGDGTDIFQVLSQKLSGLLLRFANEQPLKIIGFTLLIFGALSILGFVLQYFFNRVLQLFAKVWRGWLGLEEVYYYELDARIEEHISSNVRLNIFEGDSKVWMDKQQEKHPGEYAPDDPKYFCIGQFNDGFIYQMISLIQWLLGINGPVAQQKEIFVMSKLTRKYYRVERSRDDEALHKVNFETRVVLPKGKKQRRWSPLRLIFTLMLIGGTYLISYLHDHPDYRVLPYFDLCQWGLSCLLVLWMIGCLLRWWVLWKRECVRCHFTYEFLYHLHSSDNNKFVLREMRFVGRDFQRSLNLEDTRNLKEAILNTLIGTWVEADEFEKMKNRENEPITAFVAESNGIREAL